MTKNLQLWKDAQKLDSAVYDNFNANLFHIIADETLDVMQQDCSIISQKCINGVRNAGDPKPKSKKIDSSFLSDSTNACLRLPTLQGSFDCKYWLSEGLGADVAAAKRYSNTALRSAVRSKPASWTVEAALMPNDQLEHTRQFGEVCDPCAHPCASAKLSRILHSDCAHDTLACLRWPTPSGSDS